MVEGGQNRWAPTIIKWLPLLLLLAIGVPLWLVIEVKSIAIDKTRAIAACQVETMRVYPRDPDKTVDADRLIRSPIASIIARNGKCRLCALGDRRARIG